MYGATLGQSICYAHWFPNDPWHIKALVCTFRLSLHCLSDVCSLGGYDMVGCVIFSRANRLNAVSQLSRHSSCDRQYPIALGVARVMSSKLLMELHK